MNVVEDGKDAVLTASRKVHDAVDNDVKKSEAKESKSKRKGVKETAD